METGYQRGRIQDESMLYEQRKHDGIAADHRRQHLPQPRRRRGRPAAVELARSTDEEKQGQLAPAARLPGRATPTSGRPCSTRLRQAALAGDNVFAVLMDAVRCCTLGEITDALFEVGGQYRRNV